MASDNRGEGRCSGSRSSFNVARAPGALACERRACLALDTSPWCTNVSTRHGGPTGFHTMTQRAQTCILEDPALQTPPKFHEKTPNESTKSEILGGRRKKKREILGPHPSLGGPTLQAPPPFGPPILSRFGPPPFWAPPFGGPTIWPPVVPSGLFAAAFAALLRLLLGLPPLKNPPLPLVTFQYVGTAFPVVCAAAFSCFCCWLCAAFAAAFGVAFENPTLAPTCLHYFSCCLCGFCCCLLLLLLLLLRLILGNLPLSTFQNVKKNFTIDETPLTSQKVKNKFLYPKKGLLYIPHAAPGTSKSCEKSEELPTAALLFSRGGTFCRDCRARPEWRRGLPVK